MSTCNWGELRDRPGAWQFGTLVSASTLVWLIAEIKPSGDGNYLWAAKPNWREFEKAHKNDSLHWNTADTLEGAKSAVIRHLTEAGAIDGKPIEGQS